MQHQEPQLQDHQQQQQYDQQQPEQQGDPRLLEGLPAPALRRVIQLASTTSSPALCRLCCVSKGVRAAAEAAPVPDVDVSLSFGCCLDECLQDAARLAGDVGLVAWLARNAHNLQGLSVVQDRGGGPAPMHHLLAALGSRLTAWAGSLRSLLQSAQDAGRLSELGQWQLLTLARLEAECGVQPAAAPLKRLRLYNVDVSPSLCQCLVSFDQLQVLILTGCTAWHHCINTEAWQHLPGQRQLLAALGSFRQLQKLYLVLEETWRLDSAELLRGLPASLTAVDLMVSQQYKSPASSSDLAHLVHLTSLLVRGFSIEPSSPAAQQQHPEQQQAGPPALKALSVYPFHASSWYAAPTLEAVEVAFGFTGRYDRPPGTPSLVLLAGCPLLRQLAVQYDQGYDKGFTAASGLSALTQITRLRLETMSMRVESEEIRAAAGAAIGREVGALGQLQLLEVDREGFMHMQPQAWLSAMHSLTRLVVLVSNGEVTPAMSRQLFPGLTDALAGLHSSSSDTNSCSSSGAGAAAAAAATAAAAVSSSSSGSGQAGGHDSPGSSRPIVQLTIGGAQDHGWSHVSFPSAKGIQQLQMEVAAMGVLLPRLQVVCGPDTYTRPCWTSIDETRRFDGY